MDYEQFIQTASTLENTVKAETPESVFNTWTLLVKDMPPGMQTDFSLSSQQVLSSQDPLAKTVSEFYAALNTHPLNENITHMQRYRGRQRGRLSAASMQAREYDKVLKKRLEQLRENMAALQKQISEVVANRKRCADFIVVYEKLREEYAGSFDDALSPPGFMDPVINLGMQVKGEVE